MKTNKRFLVMMVASLLTATSVWASGTITVIEKLNGAVNENAGTVANEVNQTNNVCTLTVTPATGNYADVNSITVERVISGNFAQVPRRSPNLDNLITVTPTSETADPSKATTYTFQMPGADYDVEVTVNFKSRTSIATATITLAQSSFTYDGADKTPAVTSVVVGSTTLTAGTDYSISYDNNIDAGTQAEVVITGEHTYTGEAIQYFTINKATITPTVSLEGWTYGNAPEVVQPTVGGNSGQGAVTITYKAQGTTEFTSTVPQNAGTHTVKAVIAESDNYQAGEATNTFTIAKADLNLSVTMQGWTYGDAANDPVIEGNAGSGATTITYRGINEDLFSETVPTNAGSYEVKVVVAETTNYNSGEDTAEFTIAQANFSQVTIADIANQEYTSEAIEPAVTVTYKGNTVDASEYTVAYSNNENVGTATVTLTTTNVNFAAGTTAPTKTFQIVPAQAVITASNQTVTYNGNPQDFTNFSVDKSDAENVDVAYYASAEDRAAKDNRLEVAQDAATYYVRLTLIDDNYTCQPVDVLFTIEPKTLTNEMVSLSQTVFEYNGTAVTPEPSVVDGEDNLTGDDYDVSYQDNNKVGTAKVIVTGKNNYTGSVEVEFTLVRDLNLSFGTRTWATYYAAEDLTAPQGLKVYIVTNVSERTVTAQQINYIPKNVGVLIENVNTPESFYATAWEGETSEFSNNMLRGTSAATDVTGLTAENDIYVLYNDEFVKSTAGMIPANRSYLPLAKGQAAGGRLSISFDDEETTGIARVNGESVATDGAIYTLNGVRVEKPTKGLYIVNGKKVVIK